MQNQVDVRPPRSWMLASVFTAYFTGYFIISTLNVALPRIAAGLDGMAWFAWALSIPALAAAFATLTFGKLSDLFGRRAMLLVAVGFMLVGAILSAISRAFTPLVMALGILSLGQGAIAPLCFSVLGDMYAPAERSKWAGLLNIASGITAFIGPVLGGWFVDNPGWRYVFWADVPLVLLSGIAVLAGLPGPARQGSEKIDALGSVLLAAASSTMILGFSWAGTVYAWGSIQIVGLLGVSAALWAIFLRYEAKTTGPLLDLQILTNRTFITASAAALISSFGLTAIMSYYPLFLQGIQGASATLSGKIITPFSVLTSFLGVPAGFLIARTKRYRWMYIGGYATLALAMFGTAALTADTALGWNFLISTVAGIGLGTIPTINALVVQYALPKRLLGAATGGLYFFVMIGRAIAPAILGSVLNGVYARVLAASTPAPLAGLLDQATLASLSNPRVLLSEQALAELRQTFNGSGNPRPALLDQTIAAIRHSLQSGLQVIFLIGAFTMLAAFLLILTIPEIPLEIEAQDEPSKAQAGK